MRGRRLLIVCAALVGLVANQIVPWDRGAAPANDGAVRVLDAVETDYHEDAPSARSVAAVAARLLERDGARWLEIVLAARGPRVVPVPGLEGRHGANLRTAEELHRLLRDGALDVLVRDAQRRRTGSGSIERVVEAHLPARRLRPDGDVDLVAWTPAAWPVEVTLASDPLPADAATVEVFADALSRLRVTVAGDRIATVESLGEPELPLVRPVRPQLARGADR